MSTRILTLLLALVLVPFLAGCSRESGTPPATGHAAPDVVPGSHADWCDEHEVPETQCTRCDPSLAAAFKATGDWCAEHGLPESQCRRCNPELVLARPPEGR